MTKVAYCEADKYILAKDYYDVAPYAPENTILTTYGAFYPDGQYKVSRGFLFSANFPAINTKNSRRAAMVHDFFYTLMKDEYLSRDFRYDVDYLFYNQLKADGMTSLRAWYWFKAVRIGGNNALNSPKPTIQYAPEDDKKVYEAGWQAKDLLHRK
jgi:hypothetical protein